MRTPSPRPSCLSAPWRWCRTSCAVKWFVAVSSISWAMLTVAEGSRGDEQFPEGAGARLTSGRLRRRIRLICADYPRGQSRMTPLRQELPLSSSARHPNPKTRRRKVSARTLQSCPPRAVVDAARESHHHGGSWRSSLLCRHGRESAFASRHGGPDESHELTGDGGHGDRRTFAVADEMAIAAVKPLLGAPRLSDDRRWLPVAPAGQRVADWGDADSAKPPRRERAGHGHCRLWSAPRGVGDRPRRTRWAPARGTP
jgi:hypothetical protein